MASDRWLIDQPVHNVVDRWGIENWAVCEKRQFATGRRCLWARITGNRSPPPTVQVYLKTRQSIRDDWFNASYDGSRMEWVGVDDRFDASSMRYDDRLGLELINTIINECLVWDAVPLAEICSIFGKFWSQLVSTIFFFLTRNILERTKVCFVFRIFDFVWKLVLIVLLVSYRISENEGNVKIWGVHFALGQSINYLSYVASRYNIYCLH